ncbi:DUF5072 family protein [Listeria welshimeri]|uniref:DUF5072 family protein n=1 Tax=Listeria welshimeri TaxID=1643 RepID=UPI001887AD1B|nr:DUF5072 family protein [Listeria welshimeri]MBF2610466.1 DUF5072 family protein [Listeria welshimeri]
MLRRLSFTYVLKAVQKNLNRANLNCFVLSQENLQPPYVTIEMEKQDEVENEKLWEESYRFFIHVLATNLDELYLVIQKIEDELAVKVSVPEGYEIISQAAKGEQLMKQENNVVHAKMGYEFIISHGAKTKI